MLKDRQAFVYLHQQGLLVGSYSGPGACVQEDWAQETVLLGALDSVENVVLGAAVGEGLECGDGLLVGECAQGVEGGGLGSELGVVDQIYQD